MMVRYLGPADRMKVDGVVAWRGGPAVEISKAAYDALGPKRGRLLVIPSRPPRAKPVTTSKRRSPAKKKES